MEHSADWSAADLAWALDEIEGALEGAKTRFNALRSNPQTCRAVQCACLVVAAHKAAAYASAHTGLLASGEQSIGWLLRDPLLASATALLHRHFISLNDIDMRAANPERIGQCGQADHAECAGRKEAASAVDPVDQASFGF
jgi:hypothetical protein